MADTSSPHPRRCSTPNTRPRWMRTSINCRSRRRRWGRCSRTRCSRCTRGSILYKKTRTRKHNNTQRSYQTRRDINHGSTSHIETIDNRSCLTRALVDVVAQAHSRAVGLCVHCSSRTRLAAIASVILAAAQCEHHFGLDWLQSLAATYLET